MKEHRRQFVIAPGPCLVDDEWEAHELPNGYVLSRHRALPMSSVDIGDRQVTVLGYAIPPMNEATSVGEFATHASGRFVVMDWPHLIQDACGLLGIYFCRISDGYILTSSVALAARITDLEPSGRSLRWPQGPTYFPAPSSRLVGLRKLLADQQFHLDHGAFDQSGRRFRFSNAELAPSIVNSSLVHTFRHLAADYERLYLALTGGLDSRTLLGGLLAASVEFEAITLSHPGVPESDITTAQQLCRTFGVRHRVIEPRRYDPNLLRVWKLHTLESYAGVANYHTIPRSQYRFLGPDDAIIRGGAFELGRREPDKVAGLGFGTADGRSLRQLQGPSAEGDHREIAALDEWLAWRSSHDIGLDFAESYYYDQRIGSWLASVEQGLDAQPAMSMQPANTFSILESLLSVDDREKPVGTVQKRALESIDPRLVSIPINPGPSLAKRIVRRVARLGR